LGEELQNLPRIPEEAIRRERYKDRELGLRSGFSFRFRGQMERCGWFEKGGGDVGQGEKQS